MLVKDIHFRELDFKILFNPETEQRCQKEIYENGVWEPRIVDLIMNLLKPGQTFIDVGASNGWFAFIAASILGEKGRVIAFEPNPTRFKMLLEVSQINDFDNVTVSDKALSDHEGTGFIGGRCMGEIGESGIKIETMTLDSFLAKEGIEKVDLVKIDIEGMELKALQGMTKTVEKNPSMKIICEIHPKLLKRYGDSQEKLLRYVETDLKLQVSNVDWRYWLFKRGHDSSKQIKKGETEG